MMPDITDDVEGILESPFHPKPGGMIDRHRKERARREEAQKEQENIDAGIEQSSYKAVKVAQQSPEIFAPQVISIAPGGCAQLLTANPYRFRATIIVQTAASTVVLAKDSGAASSANGPSIPTGLPLPLNGRGQLWGFNPGGAAIQVGVIAEIYAPEVEAK
jgi:hypothetical protein